MPGLLSSGLSSQDPKELKAFSKVSLEPGQSKIVEIVIELKRATSFWDETAKAWISEKDIEC
ncbi:hypothetical protein V1505DRAFT_358438 [Lipomyces doorenjongii]